MLYRYLAPKQRKPNALTTVMSTGGNICGPTVNTISTGPGGNGYFMQRATVDVGTRYTASLSTVVGLRTFLSTSTNGIISTAILNSSLGSIPSTAPTESSNTMSFLKFSPDESKLVLNSNGSLKLYTTSLTGFTLSASVASGIFCSSASWHSDGTVFAYAAANSFITLQPVSGGTFGTATSIACPPNVMDMEWVGDYLVVAYSENSAVWLNSLFCVYLRSGSSLSLVASGINLGVIGQTEMVARGTTDLIINSNYRGTSGLQPAYVQNQYCFRHNGNGTFTNLGVGSPDSSKITHCDITHLPVSDRYITSLAGGYLSIFKTDDTGKLVRTNEALPSLPADYATNLRTLKLNGSLVTLNFSGGVAGYLNYYTELF